MNFKRKNKTNRSLNKKKLIKGTWAIPKNIRKNMKDSKNNKDIKTNE